MKYHVMDSSKNITKYIENITHELLISYRLETSVSDVNRYNKGIEQINNTPVVPAVYHVHTYNTK